MRAAYDKFDPIIGGFRARLAADLPLTDGAFGPKAVSLNATGKVVVGTEAQSGIVGIVVKNVARGPAYQWDTSVTGLPNANAPVGAKAGDVVDVLVQGHVVNLDQDDFPAGTAVYAAADGTLSSDDEGIKVGHTIGAGVLFVNIAFGAAAAAVVEG